MRVFNVVIFGDYFLGTKFIYKDCVELLFFNGVFFTYLVVLYGVFYTKMPLLD